MDGWMGGDVNKLSRDGRIQSPGSFPAVSPGRMCAEHR